MILNMRLVTALSLVSGIHAYYLLALLLSLGFVAAAGVDYTESHCKDQKQAIVHLFEWSHDAVADECINVLGPKGFCGVQVVFIAICFFTESYSFFVIG